MRQPVYVDVLVVSNFAINYLLLSLTGRFCGRREHGMRQALAALAGALGSLGIFLPAAAFPILALEKLLLSALMVRLGFVYRVIWQFLKEWLVFFTVSFLFAGGMLALFELFRPPNLLVHNGAVYFDLSIWWLLGATAFCYLAVSLFNRYLRVQTVREQRCRVQLRLGEKTVHLEGLVDTGNDLCDLFSGTPVMVCGFTSVFELLEPYLPPGAAPSEPHRLFELLYGSGLRDLHLIPYQTVSSGGVLAAFRPDSLLLYTGTGEEIRVEDILVGVSFQPLRRRGCQALLSPRMIRVAALPEKGKER